MPATMTGVVGEDGRKSHIHVTNLQLELLSRDHVFTTRILNLIVNINASHKTDSKKINRRRSSQATLTGSLQSACAFGI
jgi:hypothetical protein